MLSFPRRHITYTFLLLSRIYVILFGRSLSGILVEFGKCVILNYTLSRVSISKSESGLKLSKKFYGVILASSGKF